MKNSNFLSSVQIWAFPEHPPPPHSGWSMWRLYPQRIPSSFYFHSSNKVGNIWHSCNCWEWFHGFDYQYLVYSFLIKSLLPSATKLRRLCFYTCLSFCPQVGSGSVHAEIPPPCSPKSRHTHPPKAGTPQEQTSPRADPLRRLPLRTVRILLECILVLTFVSITIFITLNKSEEFLRCWSFSYRSFFAFTSAFHRSDSMWGTDYIAILFLLD